jgi:hypothetical protein
LGPPVRIKTALFGNHKIAFWERKNQST